MRTLAKGTCHKILAIRSAEQLSYICLRGRPYRSQPWTVNQCNIKVPILGQRPSRQKQKGRDFCFLPFRLSGLSACFVNQSHCPYPEPCASDSPRWFPLELSFPPSHLLWHHLLLCWKYKEKPTIRNPSSLSFNTPCCQNNFSNVVWQNFALKQRGPVWDLQAKALLLATVSPAPQPAPIFRSFSDPDKLFQQLEWCDRETENPYCTHLYSSCSESLRLRMQNWWQRHHTPANWHNLRSCKGYVAFPASESWIVLDQILTRTMTRNFHISSKWLRFMRQISHQAIQMQPLSIQNKMFGPI